MFEIILYTLISVSLFLFYQLLKADEFLPWSTRLFHFNQVHYPVQGKVEVNYEGVRTQFQEHFDMGSEVGSSVVVYSGGRCVVELYGGFQDLLTKKKFDKDTLSIVFSTSKFMESTVVSYLVDQGYITYTTKLSQVWPEFGKNGKADVTLADLLRHEGGLPYFEQPQLKFETLRDLDCLENFLINQKHKFDGEKVRCYHAVTRGLILNRIVKRVHPQKKTIHQIFATEFNDLFNIEFGLGLHSSISKGRIAKWYWYPTIDTLLYLLVPKFLFQLRCARKGPSLIDKRMFLPNSMAKKCTGIQISNDKNFPNCTDFHDFELSSLNGYSNAKSLAKVAACFANRGTPIDTHAHAALPFLTPTGFQASVAEATTQYDRCLLKPTTITQAGFGLFQFPQITTTVDGKEIHPEFYGWSGLGGMLVLFNYQFHFSIAYVTNAHHICLMGEGRGFRLLKLAFEAHMKNFKG